MMIIMWMSLKMQLETRLHMKYGKLKVKLREKKLIKANLKLSIIKDASKFKRKGETGSVEEYEVEFAVHDKYQRGYATIPTEVKEKLAKVGYRFHNTTKDDFADDGLATKSHSATCFKF